MLNYVSDTEESITIDDMTSENQKIEEGLSDLQVKHLQNIDNHDANKVLSLENTEHFKHFEL